MNPVFFLSFEHSLFISVCFLVCFCRFCWVQPRAPLDTHFRPVLRPVAAFPILAFSTSRSSQRIFLLQVISIYKSTATYAMFQNQYRRSSQDQVKLIREDPESRPAQLGGMGTKRLRLHMHDRPLRVCASVVMIRRSHNEGKAEFLNITLGPKRAGQRGKVG